MSSINPITNPNSVYNHTLSRGSIDYPVGWIFVSSASNLFAVKDTC
jgi:hypothetical protein